MDLLNDNLLNKYICSYMAMKYKYNLVKWVADKGFISNLLQQLLLHRISDLTHFEEDIICWIYSFSVLFVENELRRMWIVVSQGREMAEILAFVWDFIFL